jgi:ATP-dependent protease ClpP protease subunit
MFLEILTSVLVSVAVWGVIWKGGSLLKKYSGVLSRIPGVGKYLSSSNDDSSEGGVGDVYCLPNAPRYDPNGPVTQCMSSWANTSAPPVPPRDEFTELLEKLESEGDTSEMDSWDDVENGSGEEPPARKIIFINHRVKEGQSVYGVDLGGSQGHLTQKDAIKVMDILRDVSPKATIDIILNTNGGSMQAAEVIINALHEHKGKIRVYIPHYAASAGTMLALVADDVYLGKNAYISPIDPQLGFFSAATIQKFCANTSPGSWFGDLARMFNSEAEAAMKRIQELIFKAVYGRGSHGEIFEELASGKYNHDRPIFFSEARKLIPYMHSGIHSDIYRLFDLHNKKSERKCGHSMF